MSDNYFPLDLHGRSAPPPDLSALDSIRDKAIAVIKTIYDPEIPVDIFALGLIYSVTVTSDDHVTVVMTLTSPGCFAAGQIPGEVEKKILEIPEVKSVRVELTFDPPWDKTMMSEEAQLELGFW